VLNPCRIAWADQGAGKDSALGRVGVNFWPDGLVGAAEEQDRQGKPHR